MFLVALLLTIFLPTVAFAELLGPSGNYVAARSLVEDSPHTAYDLAVTLPKFDYADDVRLRLLAETALNTQRIDEAIEWLGKYATQTPNKKEAYRATLERAELLVLVGRADDARRALSLAQKRRVAARLRGSERRHFEARATRLQHDLTSDESDRAALAKRLLIRTPIEPGARRSGLAVAVTDLTDAERFNRAMSLMKSWAYDEARTEFERLEKIAKYAERSSWELGIIALSKLRDRPTEAERRFKELALAESGTMKQKAMWLWARSLMKQNRYDEVFDVFDRYEKAYPTGVRIHDIYYYRGWLPYDARENTKAIKGLRKYIKRYGKRGAKSSYIYGFLAWAYMRESRWSDAIKVWNDMLGFGNTLVAGKALYWKAFAQTKLADEAGALKTLEKLRARYPLSYYGMLGEQLRAKLAGESAKASDVWWPDKADKISDSPTIDVVKQKLKLNPSSRKVWNRVLELITLDEPLLAGDAFEAIEDEVYAAVPKSKRAAFIHAVGWHLQDFYPMWKASAGSIRAMPRFPTSDPLQMVMAYPRAYKDVVQNVGKEFGVSDVFIWSIMRQESRYKPNAISPTDAMGALQMIPKTARLVAADIGAKYERRTFFRPEVGFRFSGYYMQQVLKHFDGHFVPAAASYNTGPKVIAGWFHKNGGLEFDHLIEEFEYNEGRSYCRKVTEHMLRYVYLYVDDVEQRAELLNKMFPESRGFDVPLPADIPY